MRRIHKILLSVDVACVLLFAGMVAATRVVDALSAAGAGRADGEIEGVSVEELFSGAIVSPDVVFANPAISDEVHLVYLDDNVCGVRHPARHIVVRSGKVVKCASGEDGAMLANDARRWCAGASSKDRKTEGQ